jgi:hypothetical protein
MHAVVPGRAAVLKVASDTVTDGYYVTVNQPTGFCWFVSDETSLRPSFGTDGTSRSCNSGNEMSPKPTAIDGSCGFTILRVQTPLQESTIRQRRHTTLAITAVVRCLRA